MHVILRGQGGGGNVGAIKGILTVKMDFFIHIPATIFFGPSTNFNFKNFYCALCTHYNMHVTELEKIRRPPPPYQTSSYSTV